MLYLNDVQTRKITTINKQYREAVTPLNNFQGLKLINTLS